MNTRKILALAASLLLGAATMNAQRLTPYEYAKTWFVSAQAGPQVFVGDYSDEISKNGDGRDFFSPYGNMAIGYYFTNAYAVRTLLSFSPKHSVLNPNYGYYPYSFNSVHLFADFLVNYNALGEYFTHFNGLTYVGVGVGQTFDFNKKGYEDAPIKQYNLLPGFHLGAIAEYDFASGLGLFLDLGLEFFPDRYNGLPHESFPVDFGFNLSLGVVWHIFELK